MEKELNHPDIVKAERDGYIEEPEIVYYCEECGEPIREGEIYFNVGDYIYCEDCINGCKKTA